MEKETRSEYHQEYCLQLNKATANKLTTKFLHIANSLSHVISHLLKYGFNKSDLLISGALLQLFYWKFLRIIVLNVPY